MAEVYDEFIFVNPTVAYHRMLTAQPARKFTDHPLTPFFTTQTFAREEDASLNKIQQCQQHVNAQLEIQRQRLFLIEQEIHTMTQSL